MNIDEAAAILDNAAENWLVNRTPGPIEDVIVKVARTLTPDGVFNAAAFLKSEFGDQYDGMEEQDWYRAAEAVYKILGGK